jgi:hypothetical protein
LSDAVELAQTVGEDRLRFAFDEYFTVGFTGMPPFSRHMCHVHYQGAQVTATEYVLMD